MNILLDENIPYSIKEELKKMGYNEVEHIGDIGKGMSDKEVSKYAIDNNMTIISKDNHFRKMFPENNVIFISPTIKNDVMGLEVDGAMHNIEKEKISQPYKYVINQQEGILNYKKKHYSVKTTEKIFKKK